jgi:hypothetical protein
MHVPASKALVASLLALSAAAKPCSSGCPKTKDPKFVTVEGENFKLQGKDFHFAGSNAYYFPFNGVRRAPPSSVSHDLLCLQMRGERGGIQVLSSDAD